MEKTVCNTYPLLLSVQSQYPVLPTDKSGRYIRSVYLATREEQNRKPQRCGLCVVGMNFAMAESSNPMRPDAIRMNALQTIYPHTRVWGVSLADSGDTPTWKRGDVRSDRFWKHTFAGHNTKLVVVDYRWCPPSYWDSAGSMGLGYGDRWFVHHIPRMFEEGVLVCVLPNDTQGKVWGMYKNYEAIRCLRKEAVTTVCAFPSPCQCNPLYHATSVAWCQSNGASWNASNKSSDRANFSHAESLRYCDAANPFIVCYNARSFNDNGTVMVWIDSLGR